jgi:hypothetical protein
MDKTSVKIRLIEQVGEVYSPAGVNWEKRVFNVIPTDKDGNDLATKRLATFNKGLEIGKTYDVFIKPTNNPEWDDMFSIKRDYQGKKEFKADPEKLRISINQTSLNCAVNIITALIGIAKPSEKTGNLMIGNTKVEPTEAIYTYFKMFKDMINQQNYKPKSKAQEKLEEMFNAEEVENE